MTKMHLSVSLTSFPSFHMKGNQPWGCDADQPCLQGGTADKNQWKQMMDFMAVPLFFFDLHQLINYRYCIVCSLKTLVDPGEVDIPRLVPWHQPASGCHRPRTLRATRGKGHRVVRVSIDMGVQVVLFYTWNGQGWCLIMRFWLKPPPIYLVSLWFVMSKKALLIHILDRLQVLHLW